MNVYLYLYSYVLIYVCLYILTNEVGLLSYKFCCAISLVLVSTTEMLVFQFQPVVCHHGFISLALKLGS